MELTYDTSENRRHAQQHNLALRRRSPSHSPPKQSNGSSSSITLYRQRSQLVDTRPIHPTPSNPHHPHTINTKVSILTDYQFAVTEAGPSAFANIGENYYYVFVACTVFFFTVAYFYFP